MIFGIGTDIVEVERIRKLDSLEKFADKILSVSELKVFKSQIDEKQVTFLANKHLRNRIRSTHTRTKIWPKE